MKRKKDNFKIGFLGSKNTTYECMQKFLSDGFKIDQLITLAPKQGKKFQVAGYMNLVPFAEGHSIPIYHAQKYSLKDKKDFKEIKKMNLDLVITIGWQRLIPKEILDFLRIGACGMHGSAMGLPKGRGRSPLNWSLIQGKNKFITSLFFYNSEIDAGKIVDSQEFDINSYDTCETLHFKNRIAMNNLLKKYLLRLFKKQVKLVSQSQEKATYYPKRLPEDGVIDWGKTTKEIYDFIRAQTRPFPGAFTFLGNKKIYIWKAQPFDTKLDYSYFKNGEIVDIFYNDNFLVKTKSGSLLIIDWEGSKKVIKIGKKFKSIDYKETLKKIVKRYPSYVKEKEREINI